MKTFHEDREKVPAFGEALLSFARHRRIEPGRLARLMRESEPFREICADYEECCAKLLSLAHKAVTAGRHVRDYEEMRAQLERDLLRGLERARARGSNGRRAEQRKIE